MPDSKPSPASEISYCPHLGLYHLKLGDADTMFDTKSLIASLDDFIKNARTREADYMSMMASFARKFPHQLVRIDAKGQMNLTELMPELQTPDTDPEDKSAK